LLFRARSWTEDKATKISKAKRLKSLA